MPSEVFMYVCLCKGVSDKAIRQAVAQGARSWRDVREQTGCATQCGKCACMGKAIAREAMEQCVMEQCVMEQCVMERGAFAQPPAAHQLADLAYAV